MNKGKLEELADLDYHEPVGDSDPDRENKLKAHMDSTKRSLREFMEGETAAVAKKKAETIEGAQEVKRLSNISFGNALEKGFYVGCGHRFNETVPNHYVGHPRKGESRDFAEFESLDGSKYKRACIDNVDRRSTL